MMPKGYTGHFVDETLIMVTRHENVFNNKTKNEMISELKKEFFDKQGKQKARWVSNYLKKMNKSEVVEQYKKLKGNISIF